MKLFPILMSGSLVALPLSVLMSGCGAGSNGFLNPTATPQATSTPTTGGTITPLPIEDVPALQFALSDGRVVTVRLQTQGRRAFGVIETPLEAPAATRRTQATIPSIPLSWAGGNYAVDGSFTPPLSVNLTGEVRQNGVTVPFVFRGTLPTETTPGSFSLTAGGRTVTVTLPAFGTTTPPTATPRPTATLTATATPAPTRTPNPTSTPVANAIVFNGTVKGDGLNSGLPSTFAARGNSKVQRIGNTDVITGQYTFTVGSGVAILQTFGTSARLENRAYTPGTAGAPTYNIFLTQSNRRFVSYAGDGNITYTGTQNGVLSFTMNNVAFTEEGKTPRDGFLIISGTGTLTDAR